MPSNRRGAAVAFSVVLFAYAMLRFQRQPSRGNAILAGMVAGAACLVRITALSDPTGPPSGTNIQVAARSTRVTTPHVAVAHSIRDPADDRRTAARFRLEIESPDGLVAGVMGLGSRDEAADLPGGSWKRVRLVFNAAAGTAEEYRLRLLLYDVTETEASAPPHETAEVVVRAPAGDFNVQVEPIGDVGAALQTGIRYSLERGGQYLVTFDGDGQHALDDIERLIDPIRSGQANIVLGSCFLGSAEGITLLRWMLLKAAVIFTRLASRAKVTDAHNGLRAFSRRAAERLIITVDRMGHASEIVDQVGAMGLPYIEIPVHIRYTEYSRSKGQSGLVALRILGDYLVRRIRR